MKRKTPCNKNFSFHSIASPFDFIARIKDEAANSNLKFEQLESGVQLELGSHHGGRIVYMANISADEDGGSFIRGEITTLPWNSNPGKKKTLFAKIMSVLGFVILLPFVLVFLLCYGVYSLFVRWFRGKNSEPTHEEILLDFMLTKICCKQWDE